MYEFIVEYFYQHGYSPTVREIGYATGLKSPSTVHGHIDRLVRDGKLNKKDTSPRTLVTSGHVTHRIDTSHIKNRVGSHVLVEIIEVDNNGNIEQVKLGDRIFKLTND